MNIRSFARKCILAYVYELNTGATCLFWHPRPFAVSVKIDVTLSSLFAGWDMLFFFISKLLQLCMIKEQPEWVININSLRKKMKSFQYAVLSIFTRPMHWTSCVSFSVKVLVCFLQKFWQVHSCPTEHIDGVSVSVFIQTVKAMQ